MRITVFTPTYNREHTLTRLYDSLKSQTFLDFEWLVIDDGSTDETEFLVKEFIKQKKINIKYTKKNNGGKHTAINKGVEMARGELFFIVDSDDYLTPDALEKIVNIWDGIEDKEEFCGVAGLRGYDESTVIGSSYKNYFLDANVIDHKYKYEITGDKSEVFLTEILKDYPFPQFKGENFIPEIVVWIEIGTKYKLRWFNEIIYMTEYLEDGLSWNNTSLRLKNIEGTLYTYAKLITYDLPLKYKIRYFINYYRFLFLSEQNFSQRKIKDKNIQNVVGIVFGFIFAQINKIKGF